jgi:hypothetical protein
MADTINVQTLLERISSLEKENAAHYKDDQQAAQQRLAEAQNQSRQSLAQERAFENDQIRAANAKYASLRSMRRNAFTNLLEARTDNKLAQSRLSKKAAEILANRNLIRSRPIIEAREQAQKQKVMDQQVNSKVDQRLNNITTFRLQTEEQRLTKSKY